MEIAEALLVLGVTLIVARGLEEVMNNYRQPPVLGDILAGLVLGPTVIGFIDEEAIASLEVIRWLGISSLLFLAGLETRFAEFRRAFKPSLLVAVGGIAVSFGLGFATAEILGLGFGEAMFMGTIMTATSVGLTVKVLGELGYMETREAAVILGAAVLDDIGGLIVMAITIAYLAATSGGIVLVVEEVSLYIFLYIALLLGLHKASPYIWRFLTTHTSLEDSIEAIMLGLMAIVAWATDQISLSLIVGAYAIGLAFSEVRGIQGFIRRISLIPNIFAMVFFVTVAASVDLKTYAAPQYLDVILVFTAFAILAKLIGCGLAAKVSGMDTRSSLIVGMGMVPRGEVAMITATIGAQAGYVGPELLSAVIVMIYVTNVLTPLVLNRLIRRTGHG